MKLGIRRWILLAVLAGLLCGAGDEAQAQTGKLSEEQLGQLITTLGLKPTKAEQRYDFAFAAKMGEKGEEEWQLSMSSILSQDGEWVWVMAWLDELPTTAADVPRTALLRLLAENDRLGNGKFFAYIPGNRRFVLQVAVPNKDLTQAKMQEILKDLGSSVVETYPQWSVANWKQLETNGAAVPQTGAAPAAAPAPIAR
jgi:hypothetical protein